MRSKALLAQLGIVALGACTGPTPAQVASVDGAAYRQLAEYFPQRITSVDGARAPREIAEEVLDELRQHS